jgi:hypothetical protein
MRLLDSNPSKRLPARDEHQARIDHAGWIIQRKCEYRCICLTCWVAHLRGAS